jgi:hypothetical protein
VFENRVLRRIFGPNRDEESGEWRILHNEEIRNLYSSARIIPNFEVNDNEMDRTCSTSGEEEDIKHIGGKGGSRSTTIKINT